MTIIDLLNNKEYQELIDIAFAEFMKLLPSIQEQTAFVNGFNKCFLAIKNQIPKCHICNGLGIVDAVTCPECNGAKIIHETHDGC